MDKKVYNTYVSILKNELVVALGCTEPIAIAYAGAKVREVLEAMPDRCEINCSGNIVKNVKGVTVPNSGGMKGIDTAATLGIVGGNVKRMLAVLEDITPEQDVYKRQNKHGGAKQQQNQAHPHISVKFLTHIDRLPFFCQVI